MSFCESYFEGYGILCGVAPTIIAAITDEMKKNASMKQSQQKKAAKAEQPQQSKKAAKAEQPQQSKKAGEAEQPQQSSKAESTESVDNAADRHAEAVQDTAADSSDMTQEEGSEAGTGRRRKRRRHKAGKADAADSAADIVKADEQSTDEDMMPDADTPAGRQSGASDAETTARSQSGKADADTPARSRSTDDAELTSDSNDSDEADAAGRLKYIYDALAELLSTRTIDIYAAGIDEAVAQCSSKQELHEFFTARYGEDEGEALYRVTQGDFEQLRQARPAKKSGRRYHRYHKSSKNRN